MSRWNHSFTSLLLATALLACADVDERSDSSSSQSPPYTVPTCRDSALPAVVSAAASVSSQAPQPYASYWFPSTLLDWSPENDPDAPFNRSTVPLARRTVDSLAPLNRHARAEARVASLAIFDATSGHPAQGRWDRMDAYAFTYWQYLDLMVMWGGSAGEGLILAPAPYITDAGHRNGVPVLGTVFFPPTAYGGQFRWVDDFVQQRSDGSFPVADKLIEVARHYGFDGWFINQETRGGNAADADKMQSFMKYFQAQKDPHMQVFWYDSMIDSGAISWQNALNDRNAMFFDDGGRVSDHMFLNFWWRSAQVTGSRDKALSLGRDPYDVYAGIDVQARGYNTSVRWGALFPDNQAHKLSLAMYVPSWTWHSAADHSDFVAKENRFWVGANGDPKNTDTTQRWKGLAHYIPARTPVTTLPFVSDFNTGQGKFYNIEGRRSATREWSNLSVMDVMPTWRWIVNGPGLRPQITWNDAYHGGSSLRVAGHLSANTPVRIPLYKSAIELPSTASIRVVFKRGAAKGPTHLKLVLGTGNTPDGDTISLDVGNSTTADWNTRTVSLAPYAGQTITSIQLHFESPVAVPGYELHIGQLAIVDGNVGAPAPPRAVTLDGLEVTSGKLANMRLHWQASTDAVYTYNIFQQRSDGTRVFLGSTPNTSYFVKGIERPDEDTIETIAIQAVGQNRAYSHCSEIHLVLDWSDFPPPPGSGSNIIGGGTARAQYNDSPNREGVENAFDNNDQTKWLTFHSNAWIQYEFTEPTAAVVAYKLISANDFPSRDPRDWELLGSDDGVDWTVMDTRSQEVFQSRFQEKMFTCAQPGGYRFYRLNILANNGANETQLAELQLFAE